MMQSVYIQRIMKKNADMGQKKQTQFKANNQSSLITNHLEGKPNSNPISKICPRQKPYEKTTKFENKKVDSKPVGC